MELVDIAPLETWMELETEIHNRTGLDVSVFDIDGVRITDNRHWANELCPVVKSTDKGQTFICAVAHSNIAAMARKAGKSIIEECDGGMIKLVIPIFVEEEFLGVIGGCGLTLDDGEVDPFYIHKTTGLDEELIEDLSEHLRTITTAEAESTISLITERIARIVAEYENRADQTPN